MLPDPFSYVLIFVEGARQSYNFMAVSFRQIKISPNAFFSNLPNIRSANICSYTVLYSLCYSCVYAFKPRPYYCIIFCAHYSLVLLYYHQFSTHALASILIHASMQE